MKELSNLQNKQAKRNLDIGNQYKPPLAPLAPMHPPDPLPFGVNANAVNLHNFEGVNNRGPIANRGGSGPITKLTKNEYEAM